MHKLYRIITLFLLFVLLLFKVKPILAVNQPKNIFGLHIIQTSDIDKASSIINSGGGDWGFATIVIRLDLLDHSNWQQFFDKCRKYHIIPIVRIATSMDQDNWTVPTNDEIDRMVDFLNQLNWPTTQRIVIPFNEVNHATEWGGSVDVTSFEKMFTYTATKLKQTNSNFYILSSPLDLAAPEKPPSYKSPNQFYKELLTINPNFFDNIDALASHSYPNHGYIGTPNESGQHSIRGFVWEKKYLKSLGINKNLPVFITETGWPHREGESTNNRYYTAKTSAKFLNSALNIWQKYPDVVAVTPFIYNYPYPPFDHFSWVDKQENIYPPYQQIVDLPKLKNSPPQKTSYQVEHHSLPWLIFPNQEYSNSIVLKNTGESIWGETKFCLTPVTSPNLKLDAICNSDINIIPGQTAKYFYKFSIIDSGFTGPTFLGWEGIGLNQLDVIRGNPTIYQSQGNIFQIFVQNILNRLI